MSAQRDQTPQPARNRLERMIGVLYEPVDIAFLIGLRIVFGSIMLWEVCRYFRYGWIERYYIAPVTHFTYFGFDWVEPWPGDGMFIHFAMLGVCALCIIVGFSYRVAAGLFFAGFTYVFLLDQVQYLNHFYLICLISFLMAVVPAERACSIDAWLRPQLRSSTVPRWVLILLRFQIGVPYVFGGIAKLAPDWLRGEPMRAWLADRKSFPLIGPYFEEEWMVWAFVYGGLLLDLFIVPLLLCKKTRLPAFAAAALFHLMNAQLFRIGIFPWLMLAATLVFFPPDMPRRLLRWISRRPSPEKGPAAMAGGDEAAASKRRLRRWGVPAFLACYMLIQVLMPMRHLLYPGDVNWTEEGHRFSWHMKLRTKRAETAQFIVSDAASGETQTIDPAAYLTRRQFAKMPTHPDMILQFSHFLARQAALDGRGPVEVRAMIRVSLNGRKPQLLVNPEVDLAAEPRSLRPAHWIVPLVEPLPAPDRSRGIPPDMDE